MKCHLCKDEGTVNNGVWLCSRCNDYIKSMIQDSVAKECRNCRRKIFLDDGRIYCKSNGYPMEDYDTCCSFLSIWDDGLYNRHEATKLWKYGQNNTGGVWVRNLNVTDEVYIEAKDAQEADEKALIAGIYFDGVMDNMDCGCCGDRWYRQWEDGEDYWDIRDENFIVYYADGEKYISPGARKAAQ